ncbi:MAG: type II toxin-antitoxin system HipA family toxin [Elusimicrobiota bacterium]|jgi:serine/threonine-protein kinase HipA|nr:type II toxin-antitoxin system HipA family toxin [Elusimicrobiota bacterium]
MINFANVKLWDNLVGVLSWDAASGVASFEYEQKFIQKGLNIAPIKMPLAADRIYSFAELNKKTFKGLPGLLLDSLPDKFGNALINEWLARQGRAPDSYNSVERLLYQGKRSMGALEFEPAQKIIQNTSSKIELEELIFAANKILSQTTKFTSKDNEALSQIIKVGTSAGGARAKAVIAYNEKTREVRSGQAAAPKGFSHWLLKLDAVEDKTLDNIEHFGRIEYAYYKMAVLCKIEMSQSRLFEENGRFHFMTRRFDRVGNAEKLHTQTLCALEHFDFNASGAYSYEQIFQTIRSLKLPYNAAEQIYRRMIFNASARNQDDHTKNFSFIMDKTGAWSLAPAYDMVYAYNPLRQHTSQHQLSINGKRDNFVKNDFMKVAQAMGVKKADEIIEEVINAVSQWDKIAKQIDIPSEQIKTIKKAHRLKI